MNRLLFAVDVCVAYGAREALSAVNLNVATGEIVALIGPNGAGKTTLLRTLAGLLLPKSGVVHRSAALRVAYLAQFEEVPLEWTARDVVDLGRLPYVGFWKASRATDAAAVRSAMLRTDTLAFADRRLRELSGGERQRVALARALAQEPALLLLDEPTAHLDLRHQGELLRALRLEAARGVASVVVMHDLALASQADRCVLMRDGKIVAHGEPEKVLRPQVLSETYQTTLDVMAAADGRRAVMLQRCWPASAAPNEQWEHT